MWLTETHIPQPKEIREADDRLDVRTFIGDASQGIAYRWTGDFHRAKDFLIALNKRIDKSQSEQRLKQGAKALSLKEKFHLHRQSQASRARLQARLLIRVEPDLKIDLKRAPDVSQALSAALEHVPGESFDLSLRELLGMIGAHEWRKKGLLVPALGEKIHSHYGVFAPVRGEYLDLVAEAKLPSRCETAFDIGTGTGVLAAILAKRGLSKIVATDSESRALRCAKENIVRLGYEKQVEFLATEFFPPGQADLIVCNPPWVPARPTSRLENAVYDFESSMLRGFLKDAGAHLNDNGEVWLILSDLAELLGLRAPEDLPTWITSAGLEVVEVLSTSPRHPKSKDDSDPLFEARSQETTKLWKLRLKS